MFLPVSKKDVKERNIEQFDFIIVSGDAYIDHSTFGIAIISRLLESRGYSVGIIAQPNWRDTKDFQKLGRPKYSFLISSGNIDSMVNHYTVNKKRRRYDYYSPNGKIGLRPDRACIVYSNKIRELYKDVPIILGGLEASLRRLAHYDYWDDSIRRSILLDSSADLIVYGMGEKAIIEIAEGLEADIPIEHLTYIDGTVYRTKNKENIYDYIDLPSYKQIKNSKEAYASSFIMQYKNTDCINSKTLVEEYDEGYVVQNIPAKPLTRQELDDIYELPYERNYHDMYEKMGGVPAINEVKFSLVSNRGCFGGCNFCAITYNQGRMLQVRSHESILREALILTKDKDFKGYIHDLGGPTANFRHPSCEKQKTKGVCKDKQCLFPKPCNNLIVDHSDYLELLRKLRNLDGVKKVFIRSGIRYDYLMYDKDDSFFHELVKYHISGQLRVAPEHIDSYVLDKMGKPDKKVYDRFVDKFNHINKELNKKQYIVPYLISSHPGSDLNSAIKLAEYIHTLGYMPEQVQDFYPTPGTLSTCMYYTGLDPRNMEKIYVPKSKEEKLMQRALIQYKNPKNYNLVYNALINADRKDLIGYDKKCLIKPRKGKRR